MSRDKSFVYKSSSKHAIESAPREEVVLDPAEEKLLIAVEEKEVEKEKEKEHDWLTLSQQMPFGKYLELRRKNGLEG